MDNHSQSQQVLNFNRSCFASTNGWYPVQPATEQLTLGDFGQMQQGRFVVLGNLFSINLAQPIVVNELPLGLSEAPWQLQAGVRQSFSRGFDSQQQSFAQRIKHQLLFERMDSYMFSSREPQLSLISNWGQLQDDVLLKLTQTAYGFKHVMVVTSTVRFATWGLAMPAGVGAELELMTEPSFTEENTLANFNDRALLALPDSLVTQSSSMAVVSRGDASSAQFFRAHKLALSGEKQDQVIASVLENPQMTDTEKANWLNGNLLERLTPGAININNCIDSFTWVEAGLDDLQG